MFSFSQPQFFDQGQFTADSGGVDRSVSAFNRPNAFSAALETSTSGPRWLRGFEIAPIVAARDGLPLSISQNNLNAAARGLPPNVLTVVAFTYRTSMLTVPGFSSRRRRALSDFRWVRSVRSSREREPRARSCCRRTSARWARNTLRPPGEFDIDLAVGREFPIHERLRLRVRAEAFYLLNHTNLLAPNTMLTVTTNAGQSIFSSPGFGLITSARAARFMQLVARIEF